MAQPDARALGSPGDWAGTCRLSVARLHDPAQPRAKSELDVSPRVGSASEWSVSLKRKRRITKNRAQLLLFLFLDKVGRSGQYWQSKARSWTLFVNGMVKRGPSQTPAIRSTFPIWIESQWNYWDK